METAFEESRWKKFVRGLKEICAAEGESISVGPNAVVCTGKKTGATQFVPFESITDIGLMKDIKTVAYIDDNGERKGLSISSLGSKKVELIVRGWRRAEAAKIAERGYLEGGNTVGMANISMALLAAGLIGLIAYITFFVSSRFHLLPGNLIELTLWLHWAFISSLAAICVVLAVLSYRLTRVKARWKAWRIDSNGFYRKASYDNWIEVVPQDGDKVSQTGTRFGGEKIPTHLFERKKIASIAIDAVAREKGIPWGPPKSVLGMLGPGIRLVFIWCPLILYVTYNLLFGVHIPWPPEFTPEKIEHFRFLSFAVVLVGLAGFGLFLIGSEVVMARMLKKKQPEFEAEIEAFARAAGLD